jgi:hypothetical protein
MTSRKGAAILHSFLTLFATLFISEPAHAQFFTPYELPLMRLNIRQLNYSGEDNKSFAESSPGLVAGLTLMSRGKIINFYGSVDVGGQTGRQNFLDGSSVVASNYAYRVTSLEVGANYYPFSRTESFVNVYLSAAGVVSYNSIDVKSNLTFTSLPKSDMAVTAGYKASLGLEWIPKNYTKRPKWTIYAELGYKKENGNLLNQTFSLDNIGYTLGLGW